MKKTVLIVIMTIFISVWGIVPSSVAFAEDGDDTTTATEVECVYIDGENGSDDGDGTKEDPVSTFAKAREILESTGAGVIYIQGQVTIEGDETWSLPEGARIERYKDYTGACAFVLKDASLTLEDITFDGGAEEGAIGEGPLIRVYGNLNVKDGTEIRNNDSVVVEMSSTGAVFDMSGGVIKNTNVPDKQTTAAVVVKSGTTFNMSGGALENNVSTRISTSTSSGDTVSTTMTYSGGAVYVGGNGTVNISGDAVLKNNSANMGGAIYMSSTAKVNISGGKFIENSAVKMGGAIVVASTAAELMITAGLFDGNTSEDTGGAIWSWGDKTYVYGGKFVNNRSDSYGGAIAIAEDMNAFLHMKNAIIRNNYASKMGGGIWVCPSGSVMFDAKEGISMYDNTAAEAGDDFASLPTKYDWFTSSRKFRVYLSETILGGERASYYRDGGVYGTVYGSVDPSVPRFDPEDPGEKITIYGETATGLAVKSIISDAAKARYDKMSEAAEKGEVLLFENNRAWMGGAIGGNSNVINNEDYRNPMEEELRITKIWAEDIPEEVIPEEITVELLLDGSVIDTLIIRKADGWTGGFRGLNRDYLEAGRYTIKEVGMENFVVTCSEITWAGATKQTDDAASEGDGSSNAEDLSHVWVASVINSKIPEEVKEEEEEPKEPQVKKTYENPKGLPKKLQVKDAQDTPKTSAEVKGEESNPSGTSTGDDTDLFLIIAMLIAAATGAWVTILRRRRAQH